LQAGNNTVRYRSSDYIVTLPRQSSTQSVMA
jgi:hypothetical protein